MSNLSSYPENLNEICIPRCDFKPEHPLTDFSTSSNKIKVYFRNIEEKLIEHINEYDIIVGCVAWAGSGLILDALAKKEVTLLIQKEDFLRPDSKSKQWTKYLRGKYDNLKNDFTKFDFKGTVLPYLSVCSYIEMQPVRCVGNHNSEKEPQNPRMHNKFIVFCKSKRESETNRTIIPCAVWTGSFNFTKTAGRSLENALYITDKKIAQAYLCEFGNIYAISEELDWRSPWVAPEFRIGS